VALATKLSLPLAHLPGENQSGWLLAYRPEGLSLLAGPQGGGRRQCLLFIDFVGGKNGFRLARDCSVQQPLARALGLRRGLRPTVADGTAGLGSDAWILAGLGCRVTMCERSPILHALLADALERAEMATATSAVAARIRLVHADTAAFLARPEENFQAVYLDPMYPSRRGSALNSLAMRTIRQLVGDDPDSAATLHAALAAAPRVVVKRPRLAPFLADLPPSHSLSSKQNRFDVYLAGSGGGIICGTVRRP
jgi:16S rRNA (guanine1516-N2)-methyltransferase